MVAKADILGAKERIERALREFVHDRREAGVLVYENEWGHLRAVVGSHAFDFRSQVESQELVWEWLRQQVPADDLRLLAGVRLVGAAEYDALTGNGGLTRRPTNTSSDDEGDGARNQ